MKKVIPEVVMYFCDACGGELEGSDLSGHYKIKMTSDGLDYSGRAVGPGKGGEFDCCYACYSNILTQLKA